MHRFRTLPGSTLVMLATALLATLAIALAACGGGSSPLTVTVAPVTSTGESIEVSRLDLRAYSVESVDEVIAEATNPDGTPVSAVSCEVVAQVAPEATDCAETERRVLRDQDLVHEGDLPTDGRVTFDRPAGDLRIYVELPGDELQVDDHGHICRWNATAVVPAAQDAVTIEVPPAC